MPEVPSIAESGLPGSNVETYYGLSGPADIPQPIRARTGEEAVKAVHSPDAKTRLSADGCEPIGSDPEVFEATIRPEIAKWRKVVRAAGIHGE